MLLDRFWNEHVEQSLPLLRDLKLAVALIALESQMQRFKNRLSTFVADDFF